MREPVGASSPPEPTAPPARPLRHTAAYVVIAVLLLLNLLLLPFALVSISQDLAEPAAHIWWIVRRPTAPARTPVAGATGASASVHLELISLNQWENTASIRVAAHRACPRTCNWTDRYQFVSVFGDHDDPTKARPAAETVVMPTAARDVMQVIKLPLFGDPVRYPFDRYRLGVGVLVDRVLADGSTQRLSAAEGREYLSVSVQGRIPRVSMAAPQELDPTRAQSDGEIEPYLSVYLLTFSRPLYLQVLTVLLVILVAAAAVYAVLMRPLDDLVINAGALVLGVWGIRAILLGADVPGVTLVDLTLIGVILFLLVALTVRTLYLLEERSRIRLFRRRAEETAAAAPSRPADFLPGDRSTHAA